MKINRLDNVIALLQAMRDIHGNAEVYLVDVEKEDFENDIRASFVGGQGKARSDSVWIMTAKSQEALSKIK